MHDTAMPNCECEILFEANDVARRIERTTARVQQLTRSGVLRPVARTRRGVNLYLPSDVEKLVEARKAGAAR